jgi:hypothetical protein
MPYLQIFSKNRGAMCVRANGYDPASWIAADQLSPI